MGIMETIKNWRINSLEGDLARIDTQIRKAEMYIKAVKVANDGAEPTQAEIDGERGTLYEDRFKIRQELGGFKGKLAYQNF